jgi:hypothetical protein
MEFRNESDTHCHLNPVTRYQKRKIRNRLNITRTVNSNIFWDVTPCGWIEIYLRFDGAFCFHLSLPIRLLLRLILFP